MFVCTSDKDCRQLIDDQVCLYNLRKHQVFRREELLADWGIAPEQVVDLQSLVGDAVDNVPGVAGVGVKTAAKLLQEFGTLDRLLEKVRENSKASGIKGVGPKVWQTLGTCGETVALSRKLVRL